MHNHYINPFTPSSIPSQCICGLIIVLSGYSLAPSFQNPALQANFLLQNTERNEHVSKANNKLTLEAGNTCSIRKAPLVTAMTKHSMVSLCRTVPVFHCLFIGDSKLHAKLCANILSAWLVVIFISWLLGEHSYANLQEKANVFISKLDV